jgi:hypothetical protein
MAMLLVHSAMLQMERKVKFRAHWRTQWRTQCETELLTGSNLIS